LQIDHGAQSSTMGTKRKSNFHLEPLQLLPPEKHSKLHPLTPYPFLTESPEELKENDVKILSMIERDGSGLGSSASTLRYNISSLDMTNACKSILCQIDWSMVVADVVGNKRTVAYRDAFKKILRAQVEEILKEGYNKEMFAEAEEEADRTHTEPSNEGTESNSFVESDENEYSSGEYQDNEDSRNEGDDENYMDNDDESSTVPLLATRDGP